MTDLQPLDRGLPRAGGKSKALPVLSMPCDREWFDTIGGERAAILIRGDQVQGHYTMLETIAAPMSGSPLHYHAEDEVLRVVEGVMTFSIEGKLLDLQTDSTIVIPAGMAHAWRNRTDAPVRMLVTFFPGGLEDLFPLLSDTAPEDLPALAAKYGSYIVGPPIAG